MTPQEVQLLADAVKIGFPVIGTIAGTVIGGVSTYVLAKLGHRYDSRKELTKRRFELLMQAANDVTEFEHLIGSYATAVSNKVQGLKSVLDYDAAKANILNNNQPIRRARMTLKILDLPEAEAKLEQYIELTREVMKFGASLSKERSSELARVIVVGPVDFYKALAKEVALVGASGAQ